MEGNNSDLNPKLESKELKYKGKFLSYFIKNYKIISKNKSEPIIIPYETVDYNSRCFSQDEMPNEFIGKNIYNIYAINIIPVIYHSSQPNKILIVAIFRYPINKYCLEFPGSLRELEEETGYIGEFLNYSSQILENNDKNIQLKIESNIFFDPWKSSDNSLECFVKINGDDISNKKKQKLDKDELIKVYEVELDKLIDFLKEKINKDGYGCSSQLYNFALGIHFNKMINIFNGK